jgi:hypothetical protein
MRLLEELKNSYTKIHFFGLGFIQIDTLGGDRYHFYTDTLSGGGNSVESKHTHRYSFTSEILSGCLTQDLWEEREGCDYEVTYSTCGRSLDDTKIPESYLATLYLSETTNNYKGSVYTITPDTIHSVRSINTITRLKRDLSCTTDFAKVYNLKHAKVNCPFSHEVSETVLWDQVELMCKEANL